MSNSEGSRLASIIGGIAAKKAAKARTPQRQRVPIAKEMGVESAPAGNSASDAVIVIAEVEVSLLGSVADNPPTATTLKAFYKGEEISIRDQDGEQASVARPIVATAVLVQGIDYLGLETIGWKPGQKVVRHVMSGDGADTGDLDGLDDDN